MPSRPLPTCSTHSYDCPCPDCARAHDLLGRQPTRTAGEAAESFLSGVRRGEETAPLTAKQWGCSGPSCVDRAYGDRSGTDPRRLIKIFVSLLARRPCPPRHGPMPGVTDQPQCAVTGRPGQPPLRPVEVPTPSTRMPALRADSTPVAESSTAIASSGRTPHKTPARGRFASDASHTLCARRWSWSP